MADSLVKRTGLTIGLISLLLGCGAQDGADGRDGQDGQPGEVGAKGPVGPSGAEGTDGTDGQEGIPGQDGVDSDIAPPTVTIEYGPTDPSGPAATFEFSCSRPDCTFDCRLDGTGWEACSSPWFVTGLELGSHLFEVRARDGAGRDSLGEDYAWTVAASGAPMHVILIVGDGMQLAHEIAASRYLYGVDRGLLFHQFPYQGNATTWDVDTYDRLAWKLGRPPFNEQSFDPSVGYDPMLGGGRAYPDEYSVWADGYFLTPLLAYGSTSGELSVPATDSASAATALATGHKTANGNIAWAPGDQPGGALTTIAELARRVRGASIGVVSTVPFNHATPAAFVAHNTSRGNLYTGYRAYAGTGIADEIIDVVKPDVVIGGGHPMLDNPGFDPSLGYISDALYSQLQNDPDLVFAERVEGGDGNSDLLHKAQQAADEGKRLFGLYGGEGGNFESPVPLDAPGPPIVERATSENPTLAAATLSALHVLASNPNGFFVVIEQGDIDWANHANDYARMVGTMWDLDEAVKAAVGFVSSTGDDVDWSNTLLVVTSDHGNSYLRINSKLGPGDLPRQETGASGEFIYPDGEVSYRTTGHTNELVSVYAMGAGAHGFELYEGLHQPGTKLIDNTDIHRVMRNVLGL